MCKIQWYRCGSEWETVAFPCTAGGWREICSSGGWLRAEVDQSLSLASDSAGESGEEVKTTFVNASLVQFSPFQLFNDKTMTIS